MKWGPNVRYATSHYTTKIRLADVTGALLHFKFMSDFHERVAREVSRREHFAQGSEYGRYSRMLAAQPRMSLDGEDSVTYEGTSQLVALHLLAIYLGQIRGTLTPDAARPHLDALTQLPLLLEQALKCEPVTEEIAKRFYQRSDFLYLGRGVNYPIALEGALKLKEISYIHAEGYPAGEMKHGPIALIDESMPVVAIVTKDALYEKMISQVQQAKARGGVVIALATDGDEAIRAEADHVLYVPEAPPLLAPIVNVIPLQLLSYHIAVRRGADVDQPRNLAKSVTVE